MDDGKKVCVLLWNQLSIDTLGGLRICCSSYDGAIYDQGKRVQAHTYSDLSKLTSLKSLKEIREQMLAGQEPSQCERCWKMERTGQVSFRKIHNGNFKESYNKILAGDHKFKLEYLSLDFGNKCNLACKMCIPTSSTLLAKEQSLAEGFLSEGEVSLAKKMSSPQHEKQWYESDEFWKLIEANVSEIRELYIIGGEPFIIPEHERLLELIVAKGKPANITVTYNSNLTTVPTRLIELWSQFKAVGISASIDGTGQVYEYIRWPVTFERVEENIRKLQSLNLPNLHLSVSCTIQNLNLKNIPTLIRTFGDIGIFFIPVHNPEYLHVANMPREVIEQTLTQIKNVFQNDKLEIGTMNSVQSLMGFLSDVLKNYKENDALKEKFFRAMKFYDLRRKQNLLEVHPYFNEWALEHSFQ